MKKVFFLTTLLVMGFGCATKNGWQGERIPYPLGTPFDGNEFARTAYLDGFRRGYRAQVNPQPSGATELITGPYARARELGFYAGVSEGRREQENPNSSTIPTR